MPDDLRRHGGSRPPSMGGGLGLGRIAAPLHPIFVHFSIALTGASLGFDLAGVLLGQASLAATGWWNLAAAAIVTPGTIVTGIVSRVRLPMEEGAARSYLRAHMALGPIFFGALLLMTIWRAALWDRAATVPWTYLAAMVGLICVMAVQGYLGGELVYRFGAEVRGRFRQLATEPRGTVTGAAAARSSRDPSGQ
jgi:uncharacterized membrane protein